MAAQEVLNQEEVNALLNAVDSGDVNTDPPPISGEVRPYDFQNDPGAMRLRMPAFELINERLARSLRVSFYNLLRRPLEIAVMPLRSAKFADYAQSLALPSNLNLVRVNPLRGTALFALDPKLVFCIVDNFFGGNGRQQSAEAREFAPTEMRVIQMLLRSAFNDMREAWAPVAAIDVEHVKSEVNPSFVQICSPAEPVVICGFQLALEGGGGDLQIVLPMSMLEPLKEVLEAGASGVGPAQDDRWLSSLKEDIQDAEIELSTMLGHASVTLSQLINLKAGDVIPCDFSGKATVLAEGVPLFRGSYGVSRGHQSVRFEQRVRRPRTNAVDALLLRKTI
ncbi:MAG TPA: flagellar motor switch protein FliM [Steroidobacteraceae bacterium]|jgi:flagellar motor switch protein FliM|nr:flagellar motor switch protein FliM [Steroidobacteraceae bacterium]